MGGRRVLRAAQISIAKSAPLGRRRNRRPENTTGVERQLRRVARREDRTRPARIGLMRSERDVPRPPPRPPGEKPPRPPGERPAWLLLVGNWTRRQYECRWRGFFRIADGVGIARGVRVERAPPPRPMGARILTVVRCLSRVLRSSYAFAVVSRARARVMSAAQQTAAAASTGRKSSRGESQRDVYRDARLVV